MLDAGEGAPLLPRQARSIAKRQRIMQAARGLFAEVGYDAAGVETIARRADITVGAFYLSFRSKRELLVALMNELLAVLHGLELTPPGGADLRRGLRAFLRTALRADRENYGTIKAWNEAVSADAELVRLDGAIARWTERRVRRVLESVSRHPRARRPANFARFVQLIDRQLWMFLGRAADLDARAFDAEAEVLSDIIYHYLIRDGGIS